ncbi:hypothetical protein [Mycobacterium sp. SMC-4]|uniref:hypothetical protein n=1 Tax=Mycobacterium sp. SMC-4 TaxID=2857059 RepID=UPI0021B18F18|nr:hypothetical protein [Mycobacterium sp. SMC-4]UXA19523.1 hypothetical protein KXD98_07960 [Mycobacterium sp. SMC-4]
MAMKPDRQWTDTWGDKLELHYAGSGVVIAVVRRGSPSDTDHPCVELDSAQQRELLQALQARYI